jgi:2-succinyl-6-hydroxy-2,4-cyclohexadiene-1-carboxylate synthase
MPAAAATTPSPSSRLYAASGGENGGARLVMAHGFTQTHRVWGGLDILLGSDHRVVALDMPGHGRSAAVRANLDQGAELMAAVGAKATYLGYSMGARFTLHLALAHPGLVERLILISGTAGLEDEAARRDRRRADEHLADQLDPPDGQGGAVPVDVFVSRWLDGPLFAGIDETANGFAERVANTGAGLASSLRLAGTGTQRPLWDRLGELTMPVLIVTGGLDAKFTVLGDRLARAIGSNASMVTVPEAGHAPHLQRPDLVARAVRSMPVVD